LEKISSQVMREQKNSKLFNSLDFINKLIERDESSVELIVQHYTNQLTNAAYGMGLSNSDADELIQNSWITFFEKIGSFEKKSHIRTFLFGIFYNKSKELHRERVRHTSDSPFEDIMANQFDQDGNWKTPPMSPEETMLVTESMEIVNQCLELIPKSQRMAFFLREINGDSSEETCKILDISITNLGVLIYRAKNQLRNCIERKSQQ
jgi:RNA polymerase sigma-70 factor, ECF subfamily